MMNRKLKNLISALLFFFGTGATLFAEDAGRLVEDSFNYMRGKSSIATVIMTVQRPNWTRRLTIKAWTRGQKESLFYIQAPPKDSGNGTLKRGGNVCACIIRESTGSLKYRPEDVDRVGALGAALLAKRNTEQ